MIFEISKSFDFFLFLHLAFLTQNSTRWREEMFLVVFLSPAPGLFRRGAALDFVSTFGAPRRGRFAAFGREAEKN